MVSACSRINLLYGINGRILFSLLPKCFLPLSLQVLSTEVGGKMREGSGLPEVAMCLEYEFVSCICKTQSFSFWVP